MTLKDGPWKTLWGVYKDVGREWFEDWGLETSNRTIQFLIDKGYVVSQSGSYRLTEAGFEFAVRLDQYIKEAKHGTIRK